MNDIFYIIFLSLPVSHYYIILLLMLSSNTFISIIILRTIFFGHAINIIDRKI